MDDCFRPGQQLPFNQFPQKLLLISSPHPPLLRPAHYRYFLPLLGLYSPPPAYPSSPQSVLIPTSLSAVLSLTDEAPASIEAGNIYDKNCNIHDGLSLGTDLNFSIQEFLGVSQLQFLSKSVRTIRTAIIRKPRTSGTLALKNVVGIRSPFVATIVKVGVGHDPTYTAY